MTLRWPVYDSDPSWTLKPHQVFDNYWAAVDAVLANPKLYIGEPEEVEQLTEVHGDPLLGKAA